MNLPEETPILRVSLIKTAVATAVYGVLHSVLASHWVKALMVRAFGQRHRNGLFRVCYIAQALCTFGVLVLYLARLPDRQLYRAPRPIAMLLRGLQFMSLLYAVAAAHAVSIPRITGLTSLSAWLSASRDGTVEIPPEPEAQGPARTPAGPMSISGPFRLSRHPLNLVPVPIFWLTPQMTAKHAVFSLVSTIYLVLGSWHEEMRLKAAHGRAYEQYQQSGVPFYMPKRPPTTLAEAGPR
ncbi:MAG TPA: hypothetical protein VGW38_12910 [Chloroflexota bacterium]|nr:hypothetical protein [Chloroflexota bacterium]